MSKKLLFLSASLAALIIAPLVSAQSGSEPLDDERIERIRQSCVVAQASLQRVSRSDKVTRINRGRAYESLLKQLSAFNGRAVLNQYRVPTLVTLTADIDEEFKTFQREYIVYEDALSKAVELNCEEQPVTFYDAVVDVREAREKLAEDVAKIDSFIARYQDGLDVFRGELVETEEEQR